VISIQSIKTIKLGGDSSWAVPSYGDGVPYSISYADSAADTTAAAQGLAALGLRSGDVVLIVSKIEETGHFWPFNAAIAELGMLGLCADSTLFDASRSEMLLRRFDVRAVIGLNQAVIEGLVAAGFEPSAVLSQAPLLVVRPDATESLTKIDLPFAQWVPLGPTYAIECTESRLHTDSTQWDLSSPDGEIVVRPLECRLMPSEPIYTGVRGTVSRGSCGCGRSNVTDITI
jgi:hypothetical protein